MTPSMEMMATLSVRVAVVRRRIFPGRGARCPAAGDADRRASEHEIQHQRAEEGQHEAAQASSRLQAAPPAGAAGEGTSRTTWAVTDGLRRWVRRLGGIASMAIPLQDGGQGGEQSHSTPHFPPSNAPGGLGGPLVLPAGPSGGKLWAGSGMRWVHWHCQCLAGPIGEALA